SGSDSVWGLSRRGCGRACAQLLARRLTGPCARIDLAHDAQPFLCFGERREITHVKAEALPTLLEAAAHEEGKALELRQIRLRERHRRRRRAQIQDERACGRRRLIPG